MRVGCSCRAIPTTTALTLTASAGASMCGTLRLRSPTMSSEVRPVLLVFADSLAYYGPTGGLPSDDARIWPNIVASQLGWDVELIGRIGWACRGRWGGPGQGPRARA